MQASIEIVRNVPRSYGVLVYGEKGQRVKVNLGRYDEFSATALLELVLSGMGRLSLEELRLLLRANKAQREITRKVGRPRKHKRA